jgi:hypothetical protein
MGKSRMMTKIELGEDGDETVEQDGFHAAREKQK